MATTELLDMKAMKAGDETVDPDGVPDPKTGEIKLFREPRTNLKFPVNKVFKYGQPESPKSATLRLLGVGPRLYKLAMLKFNVYGCAFYAEPEQAKEHLKDFLHMSPQELATNPAFFEALMTPAQPFVRAIHLFFARNVETRLILEAFSPHQCLAPILDQLRDSFDKWVGRGIKKGDLMSFVWSEDGWSNLYKDQVIINLPSQQVARDIFNCYLGVPPASEEAKQGFGANMRHFAEPLLQEA